MTATYYVPQELVDTNHPSSEIPGLIQQTRGPGLPIDAGTPFGVAFVVDRGQINTRERAQSVLSYLREAIRTDVELAR